MPDTLIQQAREYLSPQDVNLVIYHKSCIDGAGSAYCAWKKLGDDAEYIAMSYDDPLPSQKTLLGKRILVVDFSFKPSVLQQIREVAECVMILDHHQSALDNLSDVGGCFLDLNRSGARLAFDYFNEDNVDCPKSILYIEDRDLWRWQYLPMSKAFNAVIASFFDHNGPQKLDFKLLAQYESEEAFNKAIEQGLEIIQVNETWVNAKAADAKLGQFEFRGNTLKVAIIECDGPKLISELGHHLCKTTECDFALLYFKAHNGDYRMSFRSIETDVAKIAEHFGGGGHPQAAGASLDYNPLELVSL